jgi:DNA-binding NarL/FixJ family response regulator
MLLEEYLVSTDKFKVTFCVGSVPAVQKALIIHGDPDVLVLHPASIELAELKTVLQKRSHIHLLVYLDNAEQFHASDYPGLGVKGFYVQTSNLHELSRAIDFVRTEGGYISPSLAGVVLRTLAYNPEDKYKEILTKREMEIMNWVCDGLTYKEIAEKMFITSFTVNQHLKKIYSKMQVRSKSELISKILSVK